MARARRDLAGGIFYNNLDRTPVDHPCRVEISSTPNLPPEIVDSIIDLLHDNPEALKRCCLVASSWVARARKYLFHHVHFKHPEQVSAWKKNFPDPTKSPAVYTRSLHFAHVEEVTEADASWIRSFTNVERLILEIHLSDSISRPPSLVPFHNLSPAVKPLELSWASLRLPKFFDLIFSLPPLEYLRVGGYGTIFSEDWDACRSPRPPVLTGTLVLARSLARFRGPIIKTAACLSLSGNCSSTTRLA